MKIITFGNITMIHGDNMDFLKKQLPKSFSLSIVDPPYGINAPNMSMGSNPNRKDGKGYKSTGTAVKLKKGRLNSGGGKLKNRALNTMDCAWDYEIPTLKYFKLLEKVSVNRIIWGGNYFPLPPTRGIYCWNKKQPWDNFSQFELAWTSFDMPARLFTLSNTGGANKEEKIQPTQKPVKVCENLLKNYAKPGDIILDTHAGSFSLAIACIKLGYSGTFIEKNKNYFEEAVEWVKSEYEKKTIGYAKTKLQKINPILF